MHGLRRTAKPNEQAGVTVLSTAELQRLKEKVTERPRAVATVDVSDDPAEVDELALQRQARLQARQERLAAEEAQRVELDKIEAHIRAQQRTEQIERASRLLYRDTDKVKTFHRSMLLSDVMAQREEQQELKRQRADALKRQEAAYVARQREELAVAEAVEAERAADKKRRALEQRDAQLAQLETLKANLLQEIEENRLEGELVRSAAEEEAGLNKTKALNARARAVGAAKATAKANQQLQLFKEAERLREQDEDRKIEQYLAKKDATSAERTMREAQRAADRNAKRDAMIARLEAQLLAARRESDARLDKQGEEARIAEDRREEEKAAARRREYAAIERSRQQQFGLRAEDKRREKEEEMAMVKALEVRNAQQAAAEASYRAAVRENNRALAQNHLTMAARKEARARAAKLDDLEEHLQMQLAIEEDDAMFERYVEERTEQWKASGRDIKPLQLATKKMANASKSLAAYAH